MKILHFDFDDLESPYSGGQAVRTFEINRRLALRGHDITIVTLNYQGAIAKIKEDLKYERIGWKKHFPFNLLSYFGSIPFLIWKKRFDLIVEENVPPFNFGLSPLYTSKPVISQVQCLFDKTGPRKFYKLFKLVENYGIKRYRNFIVLTESMAQKVRKFNKTAHIEVIPNGINTLHPFTKEHKNYLLFLGRIEFFQKGIDLLLESAKALQKKLPEVKIIMAGDGLDSKRLQSLIEKERLWNVQYIGKIAGEEKEKWIRESMMLLQPSRLEIFPFTMLEAASYGKPVVCFSIENLEELFSSGKIGRAVEPFNTKAYTAAIVELASNPSQHLLLSKNAHQWAEKHQWDRIVDAQEKFYYTCTNEPAKKIDT